MNKKVSTIFAMAALMGGSLFSSAYAETINRYLGEVATKVEGTPYFLKIGTGDTYLGSDFTNVEETKFEYFTLNKDVNDEELEKETLSRYLWTVSATPQAGQKTAYTFTNVLTKQQIRFDVHNNGFALITETNPGDIAMESLFYTTGTNAGKEYEGGAIEFSIAGYSSTDLLNFASTTDTDDPTTGVKEGALSIANSGVKIELVGLADGVTVDISDLNDLYNTAGFNFELKDDDLSNVTNIFSDKRVIALNVGGAYNSEGEGFPAGTYFATSVPWMVDNGARITSYDYLVQCTFIAIDSDNNIADDADTQKGGEGFTLTEVSGKDLVLYVGGDEDYKAKGNQISVYNACFTVKESTTEENVFALSVEHARFVEASSSNKQIEKELSINATDDYDEIVTFAADNHFIFEFTESSAIKPSSLLFKGDTASIYNIRLYKANGADDTRNGKYLTATVGNDFIAKGQVLADLDAPAYQWVISKVDGSDITFTNRETGKTLTTQLFDEGNGIYSMAAKPGTASYQFYVVDKAGNVDLGEENGITSFDFDYSTKIELIPSKAVNYSGYVNVDDETLMTISFGRDIAPTSNKLYPFVTEDGGYSFVANKELTNEVGKAAQWLLIKNPTNNYKHSWAYDYVYANGDLINTKNNGDVVYANTYALQLVLDGNVVKAGNQPYYLHINSNDKAEITLNRTEFYIQENVDGSVLLKTTKDGDKALLLNDGYAYNATGVPSGSLIKDMNELALKSFDMDYISETISLANEVKTYLIAEAPAVSLPGNEGHYSFVSETGNYITKDENRDAFAAREESEAMYLYVTDKDEVVPSFYVTLGKAEAEGERMFLFNPTDSINYYVADGAYDKKYQWSEEDPKAIFKAAAINESRDTLTTSIKGETTLVAKEANNTEKVNGGLNRFKMQILEAEDADGMYVVRQVGGQWLKSINGKLAWGSKTSAMKFEITPAEAPTANEGVAATEVKVIATDGAINIKNAAGKNVVISTILGQIVANEVLTSDNATISVPAGIAIVSVDGEEAVKVSVK